MGFLYNRQQTEFYLFVTTAKKPFRSKKFAAALGVSQLSFAPAELMQQKLETQIGAATIFSALLDTASDVQFVFDKDVLSQKWYGCSDGTTTGYMKVMTERILAYTQHKFQPANMLLVASNLKRQSLKRHGTRYVHG
ncbi:YbaK/EbsC family protein [Bacteroides sp. 519]|uniref:YbaK/EbsC family protein n=1 Tax=Bacteroides sp. 519 TaxID=2302937 RepID=UPI0013D1BC74|nr:YbaK/EbsC family protein [Bacteroides sp. 519]NDV56878.1 hypothetical protein [Bacteroides sp. 519]